MRVELPNYLTVIKRGRYGNLCEMPRSLSLVVSQIQANLVVHHQAAREVHVTKLDSEMYRGVAVLVLHVEDCIPELSRHAAGVGDLSCQADKLHLR